LFGSLFESFSAWEAAPPLYDDEELTTLDLERIKTRIGEAIKMRIDWD
jgi:hypothetical protein